MVENRGKAVNLAFSTFLLAVCIVCYVLLILLFVTPDVYGLYSLLHPRTGTIKPTVAVGLLTAVFGGATAAFVTRCVEQSLWLRMSSTKPKQALTISESHHLAQWSVSPLERVFIYPLRGSSWLLKLGGILLFATAVINPILLVGITQKSIVETSVENRPPTVDMASNRLDQGNMRYRGGNSRDNPTTSASIAAMTNLTASILNVCSDANCQIRARTTAIQANCQHTTSSNPNGVGLYSSGLHRYGFCSTISPDLCVTLVSSSPFTYANFTSGYYPGCESMSSCPPGAWSTLFGAWVNGADVTSDSAHEIHTVDCALTFGNITVTQNGTNPPTLQRDDFVQADWEIHSASSGFFSTYRIYTELGSSNSPYTFSGAAVGTGANTIYDEPLGFYLLGEDANNDGDTVARQIERNFDRATLSAYARQANASDLTITFTTETDAYVYDPKVLLVLLVPLMATVLGAWGRWSVGDEDTIVSYSPVEIARRGPVLGLPQGEILGERERKDVQGWKVWGVKEDVIREDGLRSVRIGFAAGGSSMGAGLEQSEMGALTVQNERPKH